MFYKSKDMFSQLPLYIATGYSSNKRVYIVPCVNVCYDNNRPNGSRLPLDDNVSYVYNDLYYTIDKVNSNIDRGLCIRDADSEEIIEDFASQIKLHVQWSQDSFVTFTDCDYKFYIGYICVQFSISDNTQFNKIISEAIVQTMSIQVIVLLQLFGIYAKTMRDEATTLHSIYQICYDNTFSEDNIENLIKELNTDHIWDIRYDIINKFDISEYVDDMIDSGEYNLLLKDFDVIKIINRNDNLYHDRIYSDIENSISGIDNHIDVMDFVNHIIYLEEEENYYGE